jgi:AraC family transcriptional regulator
MKLPAGHFYGHPSTICEVVGLRLMESQYQPGHRHRKHSHERCSFCLVLQGGFTEAYGKTSIECAPSTLLFYPAEEMHAEYFHKSTSRCFIIEVGPHWVSRVREYSLSMEQPTNSKGGKVSALALRLYQESRVLDEVSPLAIEGLAFELMAETFRCLQRNREGNAARRISETREFLQAHFSEQIALTRVAEAVNLHPVFLAREFRRVYGCTVGDYIRRLRIEFACGELVNSDTPLSAIAAAGGFFDQSHFTRTFKSLTGMTPAAYRATVRLN